MLKKLRRKLIILFTLTTSGILTAILATVVLLSQKQMEASRLANFTNQMHTIIGKLQTENIITHSWLAEIESKHNLILTIWDNGVEFTYKNFNIPPDVRRELNSIVTALSEKEKIYLNIRPASATLRRSSVFELSSTNGNGYYGVAAVLALPRSVRSVIVLQPLQDYKAAMYQQSLIYLFLNVVGIGALFFVSRLLVDHALAPVKESQKKQVEFIAAASHELRSPLTVIRANNAAAVKQPEMAEDFSAGIDRECARMSRLIDDLLLLAASDAKHWTLQIQSVDMDTLLINSYEIYFPYAKEKQIFLYLKLPDNCLPKICGDEQRLTQTIAVLLDNAVHYSPSGKSILLRAYEEKKRIFIEVEDHGPGISEKQKQMVFERFFRIDHSRNEKNHFGLGLSIAKELATLHHGELLLKDTPGGGCTFVLCFPIDKGI